MGRFAAQLVSIGLGLGCFVFAFAGFVSLETWDRPDQRMATILCCVMAVACFAGALAVKPAETRRTPMWVRLLPLALIGVHLAILHRR